MTQSLLPILPSLLDNESAAFAMSNVAFCLPNQYSATYYLETNPQTEYPENFAEQLKEQITRKPYEFPTLTINDRGQKDISDFVCEDFVLENYKSHDKIKMQMK